MIAELKDPAVSDSAVERVSPFSRNTLIASSTSDAISEASVMCALFHLWPLGLPNADFT
ncbi:unannotated protein [freshwater metagenome]|uniref:Unannotated protein n=1 Tax=freshwater metagenome TaxID=449393 RepID=A0A6J6C826_9ZZZZ